MVRRRRRFIARDRKKTWIRLGLLLLAAALCVFLVIMLVRKGRAGASGGKALSMAQEPFSASDVYAYTGKGLLYFKDGQLSYKDDADAKNDYTVSVSTNSGALRLAAGPGVSALYNEAFALIVGTQTPLELNGSVSSILCGKSHLAAAVTDTAGADSVQVYDAQGVQADVITFQDSSLTKFGIDAGEETLWILSVNDSGELPISTVTTYNLTQSVTNGLMTVQNQLVEDVRFTAKSIFAVGTNHIIRYNRTGNAEAYRVLCYGWRVTDFSAVTTPLFLFRSRTEDGFSRVRLYALQEGDAAAERIAMVQLPKDTLAAFLCGSKLCAFTADTLYTYDSTGKSLGSQPLAQPIDGAVKLSDSRVLLSAGGGFYTALIK